MVPLPSTTYFFCLDLPNLIKIIHIEIIFVPSLFRRTFQNKALFCTVLDPLSNLVSISGTIFQRKNSSPQFSYLTRTNLDPDSLSSACGTLSHSLFYHIIFLTLCSRLSSISFYTRGYIFEDLVLSI